mgnify:FL=1|tara:strand:- start:320 stop:3658 length:3339 start_codon:yes stop_codon:yes gene_type:complete
MAEEKIENINPLKQKSPNIELTVDEKGLNELPQTIPTDVDYFLRKQQGEIESDYSAGQSLLKAASIDNLFFSSISKFREGPDPIIDWDFVPSKELFELQQQYPEYMQNAFMEAKNEEHWYSIEKQVRDRLEIENELSKKGWVGFGARMVAAVVDPVAIGLTVATGGYAAPLLIGNKIQRIKRAIKFGALVGTENAVIESGLVALDPMKNEDDIRYAFYAGFALGAPVGGLSRVDPRIRKAEKQVKVAATRAINNLQAEEVKTFALDNKLNVNPDYIKDQRLILPKEKNVMNHKIEDDINNMPSDESEIEGIFKKSPIRFSISSSLNKSPDPLVQRFREVIVPDGVVGNSKGATALEFKENMKRQIMYNFHASKDVALRSWKRANKDLAFKHLHEEEEKFGEIMADLIEFPDAFKTSKVITPEMKQLAVYAKKALNDTLDVVGQTRREGWENIMLEGRLQNYFPHVHSTYKLSRVLDEYGTKQTELIYANALKEFQPNLPLKVFNRMITNIVKKISSPRFQGEESGFGRLFQGTDEAGMRDVLRDIDLDEDQIDLIVDKIKKKRIIDTKDPNAKSRLPFDINARIDLTSEKTGKVKSFSLKDLTDRNANRVIERYNNQVLGQAALARFANFRNNKELDEFFKGVQKRGLDNRKYTQVADHVTAMEVISAGILGRANPLESLEPNKLRRIIRLIGDYNFLRLFGQVGFAQGAELGQTVAEAGLVTSMKAMPQIGDIFARLQSGKVDFNDPILQELKSWGVPVGLDKWMHTPAGRLDNDLDLPIGESASAGDVVELYANKSKRVVADLSLLNPMTMLSQVWGAKALTMKIADNITTLAKKNKTTKLYDLLDRGDQIRYRQLGWTRNEFNRIAKEINTHAKFKDKEFQGMNLDNWNPEARANYTIGMSRWIDRVVQRNDIGMMAQWFTTDFGRMLTQFRQFTLGSYEKQLLNGAYTLAETRGQDFTTYSRFTSSMVFASLYFSAQTYLNSFGRSDRKKYLRERLSIGNLAKIGFLRSSWSSLIPATTASLWGLVSENDLYGYGRNTSLSSDFIDGIPTVDLVNSIYNTFRTGTKMAYDPTFEPSKRDVSKATSLIMLQNLLLVKNINNMIVDQYGK